MRFQGIVLTTTSKAEAPEELRERENKEGGTRGSISKDFLLFLTKRIKD